MAFKYDFWVRYDPSKDTDYDITKRIFYSLFVRPLKANKPCFVFVGGDSGEGKTYSSIVLQGICLETQGIDYKQYVEATNIFTPLQYSEKVRALMEDKELKKINVMCLQEARLIVKSKQWYEFLNQSVADISALMRQIKPVCAFISSQFIRDISSDIRYMLRYYIKVERSEKRGAKAHLYIRRVVKNDIDIEKPRLMTRPLRGYLVYPDNKMRLFMPKYFEVDKPPKEVCQLVDKLDYEAKAGVIKNKLNRLIDDIRKELGDNDKIDRMVQHYTNNPDQMAEIGKWTPKRGFKLKPYYKKLHNLSPQEEEIFILKIKEKMVNPNATITDATSTDT